MCRARPPAVLTLSAIVAVLSLFVSLLSAAAYAQSPALGEFLSGVVRIKTFINPDGRTVESLGHDREGSGIVIDDAGLVLTIGYLMVEAHGAEVIANDGHAVPANVVGYDQASGFGLLRAITPLKVRPLTFGHSADVKVGNPVVIAAGGGPGHAVPVTVVSKREFAGSWEYLLDEAIFTAPPYSEWSGAALIDRGGKLVGVGSLIVGDSFGNATHEPGNMFVPIDRLTPILADLIATGRVQSPARPWLGVTAEEEDGHLLVRRVSPGGPAEKAGMRAGDMIVGVGGEIPGSLADFYRKVWARGPAGTAIPLDVLQDHERRHFDVPSVDRLDQLKLKSTF